MEGRNITNQEKPLNSGRPAQPVDNKPFTEGLSVASVYQVIYELKLKKLSHGDREYYLANQSRNDCGFVNDFVKAVIAEAEKYV